MDLSTSVGFFLLVLQALVGVFWVIFLFFYGPLGFLTVPKKFLFSLAVFWGFFLVFSL